MAKVKLKTNFGGLKITRATSPTPLPLDRVLADRSDVHREVNKLIIHRKIKNATREER